MKDILVMLIPILVPLVFCATIALIVIFLAKYRHRERMGLIEQGINPLALVPQIPANPGGKVLFWGLALTAISLGLGIAFIISYFVKGSIGDINEEAVYFSLIFLGAGIAMLIYWRLTAPQREEARRLFEARLAAEGGASQSVKPVSRTETPEPPTFKPES